MNRVLSASEYFAQEDPKLQELRAALLSLPVYENVVPLSENSYALAPIDPNRLIAHQLYLLEKFSTLTEINENENLLLLRNYSPISLFESGSYESTLTYVKSINEDLVSKLKSILGLMTEGGSAIGVFQFVLDIIGMIPASWIGLPVDVLANGLNGIIYLVRESYLLAILNFVSMVDLTKVFAPLKLGIKPIAKLATKFFSSLFVKGSGKAAASAFATSAAKKPGVVKMLGQALGKVANWLLTKGLQLLKSVVPAIVNAVNKLTFGAFKLDKYIPKMTAAFDTQIAKLNVFAKEADDASKILLSSTTTSAAKGTVDTAVTKVGQAAVDAKNISRAAVGKKPLNIGAERAVRTAAEQSMLKKLGNVGGFNVEVLAKSEAKFTRLFPGVTNPGIKENFIYNDATKELVENILSRKSGLLSITKNKKAMAALAKGKTWKGADKLLANAIRKGDPVELSNVMKRMVDDPEFFKLISATSPDIAKTVTLFKHAPEALITGSRKFAEFGKAAAKTTFKARKFALQLLPVFLLKIALKGSECGRYITRAQSASDVADITKTMAAQRLSRAVSEILSQVYEQSAEELIQLSRRDLEELRTQNPQAHNEFVTLQAETDQKLEQLKQQTDSTNPCLDKTIISQAKVGAILDTNNKAYQAGKVTTDLRSPEDFEKSNLNNYNKGILQKLGEDTNIDPQHPIADQNPVIRAYFSDVVKPNGEIAINETPESRLDEMLDTMIKEGTLKPAERESLKNRIMSNWENDTVPEEVVNVAETDSDKSNESIFKVGKFNTILR